MQENAAAEGKRGGETGKEDAGEMSFEAGEMSFETSNEPLPRHQNSSRQQQGHSSNADACWGGWRGEIDGHDRGAEFLDLKTGKCPSTLSFPPTVEPIILVQFLIIYACH